MADPISLTDSAEPTAGSEEAPPSEPAPRSSVPSSRLEPLKALARSGAEEPASSKPRPLPAGYLNGRSSGARVMLGISEPPPSVRKR